MTEISTERLVLRDWREPDLEPWAAMNADQGVAPSGVSGERSSAGQSAHSPGMDAAAPAALTALFPPAPVR